MKLQDISTVVTGASTGLGRAIAQAIGAKGGKVALVARRVDQLKETQKNIQALGGQAEIFPTDLRNNQAIEKLAEDVQTLWGPVSILANIAGAWHDEERSYIGPMLHKIPVSEIDISLDINLRAPILLSRAFLKGMIAQKQGKIINLSGSFPEHGYGHLHYYVSKLGVEKFTFGLAHEVIKHNIQVNCISPGDIVTESFQKFYPEYLHLAINPDDVVQLILFLLENRAADHITGEVIRIGEHWKTWDLGQNNDS
jgi:NAD(P)-dependent dehydrogenase (short-subunit alcohol dehydrogenase family)